MKVSKASWETVERRVGVRMQAEIAAAKDEDWLDSFRKQSHTVTAEGLEVDSGIKNTIKGSLGLRTEGKTLPCTRYGTCFLFLIRGRLYHGKV